MPVGPPGLTRAEQIRWIRLGSKGQRGSLDMFVDDLLRPDVAFEVERYTNAVDGDPPSVTLRLLDSRLPTTSAPPAAL